ncbi:hypothetical protein B296_00053866 [Ensete ventricosum]|uniref:Ribose-5-phosphate isomerase n=1 Tax=Ensete ventricosum TaxID=4639 RepID=A0A426XM45_ENSVE|nr:hypothetical protein B296_00053866 [Ensete ventricosum]
MVVGLGSGRASGLAIKYLGRRLREGALKDIVGVPSSVSSASEAAKAGIPLNNYQENLQVCIRSYCQICWLLLSDNLLAFMQIDFAFDDADLIEERTLTAVIGRRKFEGGESIIEEKFIGKKMHYICALSVIPTRSSVCCQGNWLETAEEIDDLFLGAAEVCFPQVAESLDQIDGIVDHGIICGIPCTVIIASNDGVEVVDNLSKDQVVDSL